MSAISPEKADAALELLSSASLHRQSELLQYPSHPLQNDSDEESDSNSPIYDSYYMRNGSSTIMEMTNFSSREFDEIWLVVSGIVDKKWNCGKGKKYSTSPREIFFMLLTTLKHAGHWDFMGNIFSMSGSTFERLIIKFINCISLEMYNHYVDENDNRFSMKKMLQNQRGFSKFRYCLYATDVIFQQSFRPSGSMIEGKKYYSGKHKLYGFKTEVSVLANGLGIITSNHAPGSKADIDIFYSNISDHKTALEKRENEGSKFILDAGDLLEQYPDQWAVLMDKGYQGAAEHIKAIHPVKKPIRGSLSLVEEENNKRICSDRIIVENYFGRLTQLWNVIGSKYRWGEKFYDDIFMLCVSLTNANILRHPLRANDGEFYVRVKNRLLSIGEDISRKRKLSQQKYRAKKKRREGATLRQVESDEETMNPFNM